MTEWTATETDNTERILSSYLSAPLLPPHAQQIGSALVEWEEIEPGLAHVQALEGSHEDRYYAEQDVTSRLAAHGIERVEFTFDREKGENGLTKEADWNDIMAKAKRLINSGAVQILRNGANNIVAYVKGDHGEYQSEIGRDDPESRAITTWQCDCPWDQYAWQRTRQWKKYEGRPCAHVLASFWQAQRTPLDPDAMGQPPTPGQRGPQPQTPQDILDVPQKPGIPGQQIPLDLPSTPPVAPPPSPTPSAPPAGGGVIPPFPGVQMELIPPGQLRPGEPGTTVSMPDARMPTPFNPVQLPSTYSAATPQVIEVDTPRRDWGQTSNRRPFLHSKKDGNIYLGHPGAHHFELFEATGHDRGDGTASQKEAYEGAIYSRDAVKHWTRTPQVDYFDSGVDEGTKAQTLIALDQHLGDDKHFGIEQPDWNFTARVASEHEPVIEWNGKTHKGNPGEHHLDLAVRIGFDPGKEKVGTYRFGLLRDDGSVYWYDMAGPQGETPYDDWNFTAATFENSDMVRLEEEEYGVLEGKSEEHGAGGYKLIPKGSIGEVLGEDPTTGWVDVAFAGPQEQAGPLEPYHVRAWIEPKNLTAMPNVKKPGPFIRRR